MYVYMTCHVPTGGKLFARDEMDEIQGELIPIMKKEFPRRPPTNENLYEYFLSRTRQNLHVVLCFSPVSAPTRQLSLLFHHSSILRALLYCVKHFMRCW